MTTYYTPLWKSNTLTRGIILNKMLKKAKRLYKIADRYGLKSLKKELAEVIDALEFYTTTNFEYDRVEVSNKLLYLEKSIKRELGW